MFQLLKLSAFFKNSFYFSPNEIENLLSSDQLTENQIDEIVDYFENLRHELYKKFGNLKSVQQIQQVSSSFEELKSKIESYDFLSKWKAPKNINLSGSVYEIYKTYRSVKDYLSILDRKFREVSFRHHYGGDTYIRFGKFPKSETSRMGLGHEWEKELGGKTHEEGVSVYKAIPHGDRWMIVDVNSEKALYGGSGFTLQRFEYAILAGDIYLVTGNELSRTGADGEPLINNVFPIKKLSVNEVVVQSGQSLQDLLEAGEGGWKFRSFKIKDPENRRLAILFQSFMNDSDNSDLTDAMNLSEEDNNWLIDMNEKTNSGINLEILSEDELNRLKNILQLYLKIRNKTLVFKGYRPFY